MSRRQKRILNFILDDVYEMAIALWFFADIMVENTQLASIPLLNEGLYHAGRAVFAALAALTVGRAVRDGSVKRFRLYAVLLVGAVSAFSGAEKWMLELAVLVIGLRGADRDGLLRKLYISLLAGTAVIMLLGVTGVISGEAVTRSNGIVRYSLGFYHPNTLGMRFFQIAAMHLCFRAKKGVRLVDAAAAFAMGIFIYIAADSKTSTILLFALGAAAFVFAVQGRRRAGNAVLAGSVLKGIFGGLAVLTPLIPAFAVFGSLSLAGISRASSDTSTIWSRITQSRIYFNYYGLSWHGRAVMDRNSPGAPPDMYTLDNGYMYLLLGFGVLAFLLVMAGEVCLVLRTYRREEWMLLVILVLYLLFGMMETSFIRPHCNFFLLLLADVLWEGVPIHDPLREEKLEHITDRA